MTGAGIFELLNTYIDETGSGFVDTTSMNKVFLKASYNVIEKKVQQFQIDNKITRELQPLLVKTAAITPTNATIDLSADSADVPQYYSFNNLLVTSPFRGSDISRYAKERPYSQFDSTYTAGTAMFPRYYLAADILTVEPADATSVALSYIRTPFDIDVTDDSTEIPYNTKLIGLIIDEAMIIASVKIRDEQMVQSETMMEQKNP